MVHKLGEALVHGRCFSERKLEKLYNTLMVSLNRSDQFARDHV